MFSSVTFLTIKPLNLLILLLCLIPVILVGGDIMKNGQNVPNWDEWFENLTIAAKTKTGTLAFSDLVKQRNDSRHFFTNLTTVVSAWLTNWNLKAEMFFNMFLAFGQAKRMDSGKIKDQERIDKRRKEK